ncbi:MAG: hypothetical protein AB7E81_12405 [Hyphomicrobiaceae bacterium]
MPLQNRVTPEGEIVTHPGRGMMMGNRGGALHDEYRTLGRRRWVSRQWICCVLSFNDRHRQVMTPNRYTELFFLDEATALAAGHRPCFECRRKDSLRFATIWAAVLGGSGRATAPEMDKVLHPERVDSAGKKVTYRAPLDALPDGTFVRFDQRPHLVVAGDLYPWSPEGYEQRRSLDGIAIVEVLTPRSIVAVLQGGFVPGLHPSLGRTKGSGR